MNPPRKRGRAAPLLLKFAARALKTGFPRVKGLEKPETGSIGDRCRGVLTY